MRNFCVAHYCQEKEFFWMDHVMAEDESEAMKAVGEVLGVQALWAWDSGALRKMADMTDSLTAKQYLDWLNGARALYGARRDSIQLVIDRFKAAQAEQSDAGKSEGSQ